MPFRLLFRNLLGHKLRALLTIGSVAVAMLLVSLLDATARGFTAAVDLAAQNRLVVESYVSLFVNLPLAYEPKIAQVPGVERTCKFQWFGGRYREKGGFFAQFAIDAASFQITFPEVGIVDGSYEEFARRRDTCLIGRGLAAQYGWKIGDSIPLVSALYPRGRGGEDPWTFTVAGVYEAKVRSFDEQTMYFHFDALREALEQGAAAGQPGSGTYSVRLAPGAHAEDVMAAIDQLFENGPQRVKTTTEAEFNRQFVSMMGNIPLLLRSIGGAVLFAIFFAVLNTMLLAGRERTRDIGVLKALGFSDRSTGLLLLAESLLLSLLGAGIGLVLAKGMEGIVSPFVAGMAPGFAIDARVLAQGAGIALAVGAVSGLLPGLRAARLRPVVALREEA
jgi:putative ABC transport system permease protein